jgi:hypothetical protein
VIKNMMRNQRPGVLPDSCAKEGKPFQAEID